MLKVVEKEWEINKVEREKYIKDKILKSKALKWAGISEEWIG